MDNNVWMDLNVKYEADECTGRERNVASPKEQIEFL